MAAKALWFIGMAATASVAALTGGCVGHLVPADASLRGMDVPVMLVGSKDRVGAGTKPLVTTKVGEFEGTTTHSFGSSSSTTGNVTTTTDVSRGEDTVASEAAQATEKYAPGEVDIRLTKVKPQSYGILVKVKARVDVAGDVVRVGGAP